MDNEEVKISAVGLVIHLAFIAALVYLLINSQAALTKAKSELSVVEPIWKTGTATNGTATAEGPITKTRVFFKAQGVLLEYDVDGIPYSCHTRMLKKDFDKLDGEKKERDGQADVLLRYNPIDPSMAATEQSVSILKKEKNSYTAVKWLSIFYLFVYVLTLVNIVIRAIGQSARKRQEKAEALRRRQELDKARVARELAAVKARQEAEEKARREAAEKARQEKLKAEGLLHPALVTCPLKLGHKNTAGHTEGIHKNHKQKDDLSRYIYSAHLYVAKAGNHKVIDKRNQILNEKLQHYRNGDCQTPFIKCPCTKVFIIHSLV